MYGYDTKTLVPWALHSDKYLNINILMQMVHGLLQRDIPENTRVLKYLHQGMIKHYIKTAIHNLLRNKLYAFINLFGLAIGMALSIMIFQFVYHELSFDRFNRKKDRIYLMELQSQSTQEGTDISAIATAGYGPALLEEIPEVEDMARLSAPESGFIRYGDKNYSFNRLMYADSSVFNIFTFPLQTGDPSIALREPFSIVLTRTSAGKIFGDEDPVGKTVLYNNDHALTVTGVAGDPPGNSQISFDGFISFSSLYEMPGHYLGIDGGHNYYTYLLLNPGVSVQKLQERLIPFMEKHINYKYRDFGYELSIKLEPLTKIHLFSEVSDNLVTGGDRNLVTTLTGIALFILFIACINFINLSTARSLKRAKEIGLRKVVGASRKTIIVQFLGESLVVSIAALLIALLLTEVTQPVFNSLVGKELSIFDQNAVVLFSGLLIITLITGLIAGSIPALYVSGFRPVAIFRGFISDTGGQPKLRKILVFVQFLIASVLIISSITHFLQLRYLRDKNLGIDPVNVIVVNLNSENSMKKVDVLIQEFNKIPEVRGAAASTGLPGPGITMNGYLPEGLKNPIMIHALDVDFNYLDMMNIRIVNGRNFDPASGTDANSVLINETLAKKLSWDDPIGKEIEREGKFKVIGVVRDFHFAPLQFPIEPMLITIKPWSHYYFVSVKTKTNFPNALISKLEESWNKVNPEEPFDYELLTDIISSNYNDVENQSRAFLYFAVIAILLAGLGLYGQTVFNVEVRTKEIGIRRVFGAEVSKIFTTLSSGIFRIVFISNIIAFPVAYYFNSAWLENFASRITFPWWSFAFTFLFSLLIVFISNGIQIYHAARMNPADALRYE